MRVSLAVGRGIGVLVLWRCLSVVLPVLLIMDVRPSQFRSSTLRSNVWEVDGLSAGSSGRFVPPAVVLVPLLLILVLFSDFFSFVISWLLLSLTPPKPGIAGVSRGGWVGIKTGPSSCLKFLSVSAVVPATVMRVAGGRSC